MLSDSKSIRLDNAEFFGQQAVRRIEFSLARHRAAVSTPNHNLARVNLLASTTYATEARHLASQAAHQAFLAHPDLRKQREREEVSA